MSGLGGLVDSRIRPQIPTRTVTLSLFVMLLARLGSLNALEQLRHNRRMWTRVLGKGQRVPSADTLARVQARYEPDDVRDLLREQYTRLKRNKALPAPTHGLMALVLDGHESTASYLRSCPACLQREMKVRHGTRAQHYHRYVAAMLLGDGVELLLDMEPQRDSEDEVACATRLLDRVHRNHPRAFDVVLADALYARVSFFRTVRSLGKDALVVLKHDEWDLTKDARALCDVLPPGTHAAGSTQRTCWDMEGFTWMDFEDQVRVVRSEERTSIRRQATKEVEERESTWFWVTTLSMAPASTRVVVDFGHRRWAIENQGFNEAVNALHFDHVYHHEPRAMEVMLLFGMLAMNLLRFFYDRALKPAVRDRATRKTIYREITACLYVAHPGLHAPP